MSLLKPPKHKGQGALEYLLLCGIVGFVAILSFAPSGFLSKVSSTSKEYFSTITRVVQGDNPKPINGGWCKPVSNPGGATYRTCECPAPAFGGQPCQGDVLVAGAASGGPGAGPGPANPVNNGTCGDGTLQPDHGEQCDQGANNGQVCAPDYGKTCAYCSSTCQSVSLFGGRCGDSAKNGAEECDKGIDNGKDCTPLYGQDCEICSSDCKKSSKVGPKCGDGHKDVPQEQCDEGRTVNGVPCDPPFQGSCNYCGSDCQTKSLLGTHCGDEVVQADKGEECDEGTTKNGVSCAVTYNGTDCRYCSLGCKNITNAAPKCGDGKADILNGEQCDSSEHCLDTCKCDDVSYADGTGNCPLKCGNNRPDAGEECDTGTENGTACVPDYGGPNCFYCSTSCTKVAVAAKKCGDGNTDILNAEECDKAASNGTVCVAEYGTEDCTYCSTQCKNITVTVAKCGDGHKDEGHEQCDGVANCNARTCTCDATSMPGTGNECILYTYTPKYADCPTSCDYTGGNLNPTSCTRDQDGADAALTNCPQTKSCPASTTPCSSWKAGAWGACSPCGKQTRSVVCEDPNHNVVNDSACTGVKPDSTQSCSGGGCNGYGAAWNCGSPIECACQYEGWEPVISCFQYSGPDCVQYGGTCTEINVCGDGRKSSSEECDGVANCVNCKCSNGTVPNGSGQCAVAGACGDGVVNPGENCSNCAADMCAGHWQDNQTCQSNGCPAGNWSRVCSVCSPNIVSCVPDTTKCSICGDGIKTGFESCDEGPNNNNTSVLCPQPIPYGSNCDYCNSGCSINTLFGPRCGDFVKNGPEQCDGVANCTNCTCNNNYVPGSGNVCDPAAFCGDGIKNGTEQCDGVANCTGCSCDAHYTSGSGNSCTYVPYCGDGIKNGTEQCDGVANCTACSCNAHYTQGSGNSCTYVPYCGDGIKNGTEQCDGGSNCTTCSCNSGYISDGNVGCMIADLDGVCNSAPPYLEFPRSPRCLAGIPSGVIGENISNFIYHWTWTCSGRRTVANCFTNTPFNRGGCGVYGTCI